MCGPSNPCGGQIRYVVLDDGGAPISTDGGRRLEFRTRREARNWCRFNDVPIDRVVLAGS